MNAQDSAEIGSRFTASGSDRPGLRCRVRQAIKRAMRGLLPHGLFLVQGARDTSSVFLTFDDGPHPMYTPAILDILRHEGVRATFFVVGERVEQYPAILEKIVADGHMIGHHSFLHREPGVTSTSQLMQEVRKTGELLERLTGQSPKLFRPPYGKLSVTKILRLWLAGQTIVLWNVDPRDYACRDAGELARWFEDHPFVSGDIVLLHDVHPHAIDVLPLMIASSRSRGLSFRSLATPLLSTLDRERGGRSHS